MLRFSKHSCCILCCCCCFCSCSCSCIYKLSLDFRVSPSSASGIGLQPVDLKVFRVSLLKLQFKILHVHVHVSQAKHSVCVSVFVCLLPLPACLSWFPLAAHRVDLHMRQQRRVIKTNLRLWLVVKTTWPCRAFAFAFAVASPVVPLCRCPTVPLPAACCLGRRFSFDLFLFSLQLFTHCCCCCRSGGFKCHCGTQIGTSSWAKYDPEIRARVWGLQRKERRLQTGETADCRLQTADGRLLGGNQLRDVRFSLGKLFASASATASAATPAYDALRVRVRLGLGFCKSNCPTVQLRASPASGSHSCCSCCCCFRYSSHCCSCCCTTVHRFHGHCCSCRNAARNSMWQCVVIRLMICLSG